MVSSCTIPIHRGKGGVTSTSASGCGAIPLVGSRELPLRVPASPSDVGTRAARIQASGLVRGRRTPAHAGHLETSAVSRHPRPTPQGPPVAPPSLLLRGLSGRTPPPQRPSRRHQPHAEHGMTPMVPGIPCGRIWHGRLVRRRPRHTPSASNRVGGSHAQQACLSAHDPAARYDLTACSRVAASMMPRRRISTSLE
jgi:hypothetical protein